MEWDGKGSSVTSFTDICSVEPNNPENRFNHGKCDAKGRLWAGTTNHTDLTSGHLYRLNDRLETIEYNVGISNGIAWNKDSTLMYYIDTPTLKVDVFDFNLEEGTICKYVCLFHFLLWK